MNMHSNQSSSPMYAFDYVIYCPIPMFKPKVDDENFKNNPNFKKSPNPMFKLKVDDEIFKNNPNPMFKSKQNPEFLVIRPKNVSYWQFCASLCK